MPNHNTPYRRKRQFKTAKDRYLETILQAMGLAGVAGYKSHVDTLFTMSHEIMGLTEAGKNDTMQAGAAKSGMKTEGNAMKKYVVVQYRTMNDGSEMETERFEIDETEIDETREEMENLCGMCIDRYEIREI